MGDNRTTRGAESREKEEERERSGGRQSKRERGNKEAKGSQERWKEQSRAREEGVEVGRIEGWTEGAEGENVVGSGRVKGRRRKSEIRLRNCQGPERSSTGSMQEGELSAGLPESARESQGKGEEEERKGERGEY